jgi:hypothetical protein
MSQKTTAVSPAQAPLPAAVDLANYRLPGEFVYPWRHRCADWWAGQRDTTVLRQMLDQDAQLGTTPWTHGLVQGLRTAVVKHRKHATARQYALSAQATRLVAEHRHLADALADLQAAADQAASDPPASSDPRTAAEARETEEQRRHRRQREQAKAGQAAQAHLADARTRMREIAIQLAELQEAWAFQEALHWAAEEALRDLYAKRLDVYIRAGLRGRTHDGVPPQAPAIDLPAWTGDPLPTLGEPLLRREVAP